MRLSVLVAPVVAMCFGSYTTDASPAANALVKQAHNMNVRLLRGNSDVKEERAGPPPEAVANAVTEAGDRVKKVVSDAMSNLRPSVEKVDSELASTSNQIGHLQETNGHGIPHDNQVPPRPDNVELPVSPVAPPSVAAPRDVNPPEAPPSVAAPRDVNPPEAPPSVAAPRDVTPAAPQEGGFPIPVKPEGAKSPNEHPPPGTPENTGTKPKTGVDGAIAGESAEDLLAKKTMQAALAKLTEEEQAALFKAGVSPETLEATAKYAVHLVKLVANNKDPSKVMKVLKGLYYLSGAGAILAMVILAFMFHNISSKAPKSTAPAAKTTSGGA